MIKKKMLAWLCIFCNFFYVFIFFFLLMNVLLVLFLRVLLLVGFIECCVVALFSDSSNICSCFGDS
jgi:hypothetical protein